MRDSSPQAKEALEQSRFHETWRGWETLACDAAAIGVVLFGAAMVTSGPPLLDRGSPQPIAYEATSLGIFVTAPTVVHLAHGDAWKAVASLGLRVALPLAGFATGTWAARWFGDPGVSDGIVGAVAGGAAAMAVDASALGWQRWYDGQGGQGAQSGRLTPIVRAGGSF